MPAMAPIRIRRRPWMLLYPLIFFLPSIAVALFYGDPWGVLLTTCFLGGILAIFVRVPLSWLSSRQRARLLADSPDGTLFASRAGGQVPGLVGLARVNGILRIGADGISFTSVNPRLEFPELRLSWTEIASVGARQLSPAMLSLTVRTVTHQKLFWKVTGARELFAAFKQLQNG